MDNVFQLSLMCLDSARCLWHVTEFRCLLFSSDRICCFWNLRVLENKCLVSSFRKRFINFVHLIISWSEPLWFVVVLLKPASPRQLQCCVRSSESRQSQPVSASFKQIFVRSLPTKATTEQLSFCVTLCRATTGCGNVLATYLLCCVSLYDHCWNSCHL